MGWFSSSSKQEEAEPLSRQSREKCWESRDGYFACLDKAGVVKAGTEGNACSSQLKEYEKNCAKSWIEYFNQRRIIADAQKERLARAQEQFNNAKR